MCRIRRHTDIPELHVINLFPQQLDEPPNQHHLPERNPVVETLIGFFYCHHYSCLVIVSSIQTLQHLIEFIISEKNPQNNKQ